MVPNIRSAVRKFARHFNELRASKANESDTVDRLRHFFEEVLGYDRIKDISSETEMKGKYVDLCLKVNDNICMLVEAKAAAIELRIRQIDQAKHYAAENEGRRTPSGLNRVRAIRNSIATSRVPCRPCGVRPARLRAS